MKIQDGSVVRNMTPEEETSWAERTAKYEAAKPAKLAAEIRTERNSRLKSCDWTQVADAPVDKAAWAVYRQALRDISAQPGFPSTITWPVEP